MAAANTLGVFQLEGAGAWRDTLPQGLRPNISRGRDFAIISLYRPRFRWKTSRFLCSTGQGKSDGVQYAPP